MNVEWYYVKRGRQYGPVPPDELNELARTSYLLPTDLVWKEGMSDWIPASRVQGLKFESAANEAVSEALASSVESEPPPDFGEFSFEEKAFPSEKESTKRHILIACACSAFLVSLIVISVCFYLAIETNVEISLSVMLFWLMAVVCSGAYMCSLFIQNEEIGDSNLSPKQQSIETLQRELKICESLASLEAVRGNLTAAGIWTNNAMQLRSEIERLERNLFV